jgi:F-type H+-transporting ATPase subunit b
MEINWFTVAAQILNFFVLVWLLKRFLYKPILAAIDEREQKIVAQLEAAKAKEADAKKEKEEFKQKNVVFDLEKKELFEKAVDEAKAERQKLLDEAQLEATALREKQSASLKEVQQTLHLEIAQRTQNEVFAIARKALNEMASTSLESQTVQLFVNRLKALENEERQAFVNAFQASNQSVLVQSAFDLSPDLQKSIENEVNVLLGANPVFEYKTDAALISGIELVANGHKLSWNIAHYLDSVQESTAASLNKAPAMV